MSGRAPLHDPDTNVFFGNDPFTREGLYLGYQTNAWHFQTMYYHGFDAHPNLSEYNVSLNGFFFEGERHFGWRNHVLLRYDVASSDSLNRQYVIDVSHNIQPNIALVGEVLAGPQRRPQFGFQLALAGPYQSGKRYLWSSSGDLVSVVPANAAARAAGTTSSATTAAIGDANNGVKIVQANGCTGCHGATWHGALGPALYGIEHRMSPSEIAQHIKNPVAPMPNFGFTDAQITDIVAYLSTLDGGAAGAGIPIVSFLPEAPSEQATVSVVFQGTPPQHVSALPIMQMGTGSHQTPVVTLQPSTSDPHRFTGRVT